MCLGANGVGLHVKRKLDVRSLNMQLYMYINFNYSDFGFSVPDSRILDSGPDSVFQFRIPVS